jgi:hypothetical protein
MSLRTLINKVTDTPNYYRLNDALALCGVDEDVALKIEAATEKHGRCPLVTKKKFAQVFFRGMMYREDGIQLVEELPWIFKDRLALLERLKSEPIPADEIVDLIEY